MSPRRFLSLHAANSERGEPRGGGCRQAFPPDERHVGAAHGVGIGGEVESGVPREDTTEVVRLGIVGQNLRRTRIATAERFRWNVSSTRDP